MFSFININTLSIVKCLYYFSYRSYATFKEVLSTNSTLFTDCIFGSFLSRVVLCCTILCMCVALLSVAVRLLIMALYMDMAVCSFSVVS